MLKIRLTMSSECYCKAHREAEVCCLTAHQRLHECIRNKWTVHNTQQLFDDPCHRGQNSSKFNTPLSLNTLSTCMNGIILFSCKNLYWNKPKIEFLIHLDTYFVLGSHIYTWWKNCNYRVTLLKHKV